MRLTLLLLQLAVLVGCTQAEDENTYIQSRAATLAAFENRSRNVNTHWPIDPVIIDSHHEHAGKTTEASKSIQDNIYSEFGERVYQLHLKNKALNSDGIDEYGRK